jgi:hypothetical protein
VIADGEVPYRQEHEEAGRLALKAPTRLMADRQQGFDVHRFD